LVASAILLIAPSCAHTKAVQLEDSGPPLTVRKPALYPETIEYDPGRKRFLVSSFREGAVYAVDDRGAVERIVDDPRLCSVLGIAVDSKRGRIWAVNSDLGASLKPSQAGPKHLAAVGIYDLTTGKALDYVDLSGLSDGEHLLNGIALDSRGNAYVTDSYAPNIYQIDAQGHAQLLLHAAQFRGPGINLNGLVVHPDGYLLVIKKSDGSLFKVPIDDPARFSRVQLARPLLGGDGLTLVSSNELVIVANQVPGTATNAAFSISSGDGWRSATIDAVQELGDVYPTTGIVRGSKLYVIHSKLNELIQSAPEQKNQLQMEATIQEIGRVQQ
jgi:hypothetical protein